MWAAVLLTAFASAGCGGGGGAGDGHTPTATAPSPAPVSAPAPAPAPPAPAPPPDTQGDSDGGPKTTGVDPVVGGADAFDFQVSSALAKADALDHIAGGKLFAAWNARDPKTSLKPGMKVLFFGRAEGCSTDMPQGPIAPGSDADYAQAVSRTSIESAASGGRRWAPSGDTASCDTADQNRDGPSMVHLNPDGSLGGVGLYTTTGPQADARSAFLAPYAASGQDGDGANAGILGTFVAFRQPWWASDPLQPWIAADGKSTGVARMLSVQSVGATQTGEGLAESSAVQAKQQMSVEFINVDCAKPGTTPERPCQLEYLFNTAIVRAGITDWSTVGWFQNSRVWFDPAQGGVAIVEGPLQAAGTTVKDTTSGLALFSSAGAETQHASFRNETFDARIGFDQLLNALRIIVGRKVGAAPTKVTDAQLAEMWGARWNDPAAWALLSTNVGQEVHNTLADQKAYIGGAFKRLYVGPEH